MHILLKYSIPCTLRFLNHNSLRHTRKHKLWVFAKIDLEIVALSMNTIAYHDKYLMGILSFLQLNLPRTVSEEKLFRTIYAGSKMV